MEEHKVVDVGLPGKRDHMANRRVAPTDVAGVLVVAVLAVVKQDVGTVSQVVTTDPLGWLVGEVETQTGLMIRQVNNDARPSSSMRYPTVGPWWVTMAARIDRETPRSDL
jgi:hypothetical protein